MEKLPLRLYHYCSIDSFFNIVKSKAIWLSNSSQMNDSKETVWIENHFDLLKNSFSKKEYETLWQDSFDIYHINNNPPFVFCLSAIKDSLSQWRAYSNDGSGVAIGFSSGELAMKQEIPASNICADKTIGLVKVQYSQIVQKRTLRKLCDEVKILFELDSDNDENLPLEVEFGLALLSRALVFKNPSFKEEKEWRIIHTPSISGYKEHSLTEDRLSELRFRLKGNKIVSYYEYSLNNIFTSKLIKEVVMGPKCEMSDKEIRQFLIANKLSKTNVCKSKSTYQ